MKERGSEIVESLPLKACFTYLSSYHIYGGKDWVDYREYMADPYIYVLMTENQSVELQRVRDKIEEMRITLEETHQTEEQFDYFEDEVNILNGFDANDIAAEARDFE